MNCNRKSFEIVILLMLYIYAKEKKKKKPSALNPLNKFLLETKYRVQKSTRDYIELIGFFLLFKKKLKLEKS